LSKECKNPFKTTIASPIAPELFLSDSLWDAMVRPDQQQEIASLCRRRAPSHRELQRWGESGCQRRYFFVQIAALSAFTRVVTKIAIDKQALQSENKA
jgi:hypothetical protein